MRRRILLTCGWLGSILCATNGLLSIISFWVESRVFAGYLSVIWESGLTTFYFGTCEESYSGYWFRFFDNTAVAGHLWRLPWVDTTESYLDVKVFVPWWASVLAALLLASACRWARGPQRSPNLTECTKCHYDVRLNSSGVCPECGASLKSTANRTRKA